MANFDDRLVRSLTIGELRDLCRHHGMSRAEEEAAVAAASTRPAQRRRGQRRKRAGRQLGWSPPEKPTASRTLRAFSRLWGGTRGYRAVTGREAEYAGKTMKEMLVMEGLNDTEVYVFIDELAHTLGLGRNEAGRYQELQEGTPEYATAMEAYHEYLLQPRPRNPSALRALKGTARRNPTPGIAGAGRYPVQDFMFAPAPKLAHWTSYPQYSYDQFYRPNTARISNIYEEVPPTSQIPTVFAVTPRTPSLAVQTPMFSAQTATTDAASPMTAVSTFAVKNPGAKRKRLPKVGPRFAHPFRDTIYLGRFGTFDGWWVPRTEGLGSFAARYGPEGHEYASVAVESWEDFLAREAQVKRKYGHTLHPWTEMYESLRRIRPDLVETSVKNPRRRSDQEERVFRAAYALAGREYDRLSRQGERPANFKSFWRKNKAKYMRKARQHWMITRKRNPAPDCPTCGAYAGERCITNTGRPTSRVHRSRSRARRNPVAVPLSTWPAQEEPWPMAQNAGPFLPQMFPYGQGGRPATYALNNPPVPDYIPRTPRSAAESDYVFSEEERYPIGDLYHARLALIYAMAPSNRADRRAVVRAVERRWPEYEWANWWDARSADEDHLEPWDDYLDRRAAANPRRRPGRRLADPHAHGYLIIGGMRFPEVAGAGVYEVLCKDEAELAEWADLLGEYGLEGGRDYTVMRASSSKATAPGLPNPAPAAAVGVAAKVGGSQAVRSVVYQVAANMTTEQWSAFSRYSVADKVEVLEQLSYLSPILRLIGPRRRKTVLVAAARALSRPDVQEAVEVTASEVAPRR